MPANENGWVLPGGAAQHALISEVEAMLRRIDALPDLDIRSRDAIVGYDENGMPADHST